MDDNDPKDQQEHKEYAKPWLGDRSRRKGLLMGRQAKQGHRQATTNGCTHRQALPPLAAPLYDRQCTFGTSSH
jgi:hypothetical protein